MLFVLKKIISRLFFPVPLVLELAILGLILLWFTKRQRLGKILVTLAAVLLLLFSSGRFSTALILPLERVYEPVTLEELDPATVQDIGYVVAFVGALESVPDQPVTRQIGDSSLARLAEAVRLYEQLPDAKLILSGGVKEDERVPEEQLVNHRAARLLGVPAEDIIIERDSRDTKDQARFLQETLGDAPFLLVTSASHMPRSIALFRHAGLNPIPAPGDYEIGLISKWLPQSVFPNAENLRRSERAIYEYLGLVWGRLRGLL